MSEAIPAPVSETPPAPAESKFDLIALEQTRYGLRLVGLGLCASALARPFVDFLPSIPSAVSGFIGWVLVAIAMSCMAVGIVVMAPAPHGPLASPFRSILALLCLAGLPGCVVHWYWCFTGAIPMIWLTLGWWIDVAARVAWLLMGWVLWNYCRRTELNARALAWLCIAAITTALGIIEIGLSWNYEAWRPVRMWIWAFVPVGLITLFVAQQTAKDIWLDAVERHSKFFVITNPKADVIPLHPADRH